MNNIYFNGDIDEQNVQVFIGNFNTLDHTQPINVYLNSQGGHLSEGQILRDVLETNGHAITLIASGEISSAAFDVFFNSRVAVKRVLPDTFGMVHQGTYPAALHENGHPTSDLYDIYKNQAINSYKKNILILKKLGLTEDELTRYKEGKNVYFSSKRLIQLLQNA